jgi:hypothetical protein
MDASTPVGAFRVSCGTREARRGLAPAVHTAGAAHATPVDFIVLHYIFFCANYVYLYLIVEK